MNKRWRVIVHMFGGGKIEHKVGNLADAKEYAHLICTKGPFVNDSRGVITYYPPSQVFKVKVVPPGVTLISTESEQDGAF